MKTKEEKKPIVEKHDKASQCNTATKAIGKQDSAKECCEEEGVKVTPLIKKKEKVSSSK
jgi:hypothetical protein